VLVPGASLEPQATALESNHPKAIETKLSGRERNLFVFENMASSLVEHRLFATLQFATKGARHVAHPSRALSPARALVSGLSNVSIHRRREHVS
jgi:hypothetical protein